MKPSQFYALPKKLTETDKEEARARLAQLPLPCTSERDKMNADRHVRIVTSKMSCTQVKERVVKDSPRSKHEGRGDGS
jgi:hypothetical protein